MIDKRWFNSLQDWQQEWVLSVTRIATRDSINPKSDWAIIATLVNLLDYTEADVDIEKLKVLALKTTNSQLAAALVDTLMEGIK